MPQFFSLDFRVRPALLTACSIVLALAGGACGRSDLFSSHHAGAAGSFAGSNGHGGSIGEGEAGSTGVGGTLGQAGTSGGPGVAGTSGTAGRGGSVGTAGRGGTSGTAGRGGNGGTVGTAGRGGTSGTAGRGGTVGTAGRGGTSGTAGRGGTGGCASMPEICNNNQDDNCNGLADCADPGCFGNSVCIKPGTEVCNNGLDDDGDGKIDCADSDCVGSLACKPTMGKEICDNGVDDNADKLVDCADPQCTNFAGCLTAVCTPDVDFGTIAQHGAKVARTLDTTKAPQGYATCAPSGGVGRVGRFQLDATADVRLDFTQATQAAHVVGLYRAGASQRCDANRIDCLMVGDDPTGTKTFSALPAGVYWIIVESYPSNPGTTTVTLSTGAVTTPEICANGKDDDGNGLIDCQDAACKADPSCVGKECTPDTDLGTLVVNGASHHAQTSLTVQPDRYHPTCSGKVPGGDFAIAFTLAESAGLLVNFRQTGQAIFALYSMPGPGLACDADQLSCTPEDDPLHPSGSVAFPGLPAGRYVFIVKAKSAALAGVEILDFSAFSGRNTEVCGNGIDDDGNGLTDCDDPVCFGIGYCGAPACVPDQNVGSISVGTTKSVSVSTTGGTTLYPTSCSRGNGKERILRFNITQPMSLGIDCTDTGSHVLDLAIQLQPLDPCNANEFNCVDPATLPFGCGFSLPGVQPGTYNLIVQAFQAGDEGTVALTLSGIGESVREICDNGKDDDGDGAIDCQDRKCVTAAVCAKFACRADQNAGLLPLDGTPMSEVVQTAMAGDDQQMTACVSAPGGQDGVVDFQLPAKADLTLEWAQVGNHDFAVISDDGALFACDAGASLGCLPSDGMSTGTHVFVGLPSGRYHLIVDADRPGKEGGVVLQLSAVASVMP